MSRGGGSLLGPLEPPALCDLCSAFHRPGSAQFSVNSHGDWLRGEKCAQAPQKLHFDSHRRAESESEIGFLKMMSVLESTICALK